MALSRSRSARQHSAGAWDGTAPLVDRLTGHGNPAGKEQCLDVPRAEAQPVVEPHAVAENL